MTALASIDVHSIDISYKTRGTDKIAVESFSLSIQPGEFVCLLGPTGCGKSSVLFSIAGFLEPSSGKIEINGTTIEAPGPDRGVVFQQYALFPWLTAAENVAYGLKIQKIPAADRKARVDELMALVGLASEHDSYPDELSGGMKQRVAIARALATRPSALLMDEPFGALDAQTRISMQELLLKIWETERTTVVFVTHDVDEAILLADRIAVMSAGPGRLKETLDVGFARPRKLDELSTDPDYGRLKSRLINMLRKPDAVPAA